LGNCGCGSRGGDHDGGAGRSARGDRAQSRGRSGGNVPRRFALLRPGRTRRGQHGQGGRRRARISRRAAGVDRFFPEGQRSHHGGGNGAAGDSGPRAAFLPGTGKGLPRWRRGGCSIGCVCLSFGQRANVMDKTRPIIILKKKGGHGGHHGGAWKVAYADFVTAMMAFFLVMWLLSSSKPVQEAVGGYFKDPTGTSKKIGSNMAGAGENFVLTRDNMPKLKDQLQMAIKQMTDFEKLKNHIE